MNEIHKEFEISKLRKLGVDHANADADYKLLVETKKIRLADLMQEYHMGPNGKPNSVAQQEVLALADQRYKDHINAMIEAGRKELVLRYEKRTLEMHLELIKVDSYNQTQEKKAYAI